MTLSNKNRSVEMQCPTCGGTQFEHDDSSIVKCVACERTMTKDELVAANGGRIAAEVDGFKAEIVKDITADLKKAFKGWK